MKQQKLVTLIVLIVAFIFLANRLLRLPRSPRKPPASQIVAAQCDQTLWQYVYHPARLQVLNPCLSITGVVDETRDEPDGDIHVRFRLDQQFASLLNEKNMTSQLGDLVLEPICQHQVTQADAVAACSSYHGPSFQPLVGQRYLVWGSYVLDAEHGWNELHPVSSMQPIP